jgi:hypothetical protein
MHPLISSILATLKAALASGLGLVLLSIASHAQAGPVANTQAELINSLPAKYGVALRIGHFADEARCQTASQ